MTVKELIKLLRNCDADAKVATRDHDNSENEISGCGVTGPVAIIQC